jgi:ABC-type tungstate transport system substrate-binding protein
VSATKKLVGQNKGDLSQVALGIILIALSMAVSAVSLYLGRGLKED